MDTIDILKLSYGLGLLIFAIIYMATARAFLKVDEPICVGLSVLAFSLIIYPALIILLAL